MAVVAISDSILTDIADAIRSKNGTENTYKPSQMPDAIEAISGGGITPTGTIEITQNGVVDVTNYASADVDVPTGSTPVINSLSVTENGTYTAPLGVDGYSPITVNVPQGSTPTGTKQISITQNGTTTEDVTNYANAEITVNVSGADYPNYRGIITRGYSGEFIDNVITSIGRMALAFCTSITSIFCENVTSCSNEAFRNCTNLITIVLPKCTSLAQTAGTSCSKLESVDMLGSSSNGLNAAQIFSSCSKLTMVVLRGSTVSKLNNINVFQGTPFASGGTGGTLYVPESLKSSYQSASNWSTILGYTNNQIKSIESTHTDPTAPIDLTLYYADGTAIPS